MIRRFQIEDLVVQDTTGVLFRAIDGESGNTVAVRRFFPFGADGGGLSETEQTAYGIVLERLATIRHPALRTVIGGGCDPVDGMPFIVTEWIDGTPLQAYIDHRALTSEEATALVTQALEVSELLSEVLTEQGIWIETGPEHILVGNEGSGRGITFWVSPLKWLGKKDDTSGLDAIVRLTEDVMGWRGVILNDHAGKGLGGWLKWLRQASRTTTLHETRENLAASVGVEPPLPAKSLVGQATRRMEASKRKKKRASLLPLVAVVALAATAGAGWALVRWNSAKLAKAAAEAAPTFTIDIQPHSPAADDPAPEEIVAVASSQSRALTADDVAHRAAMLMAQAARTDDEIFTPADRDRLVARKGSVVTVEGVLTGIQPPGPKAPMYLLFEGSSAKDGFRAKIPPSLARGNLGNDQLDPLVGKKIRLRGKLELAPQDRRPELVITGRSAITE